MVWQSVSRCTDLKTGGMPQNNGVWTVQLITYLYVSSGYTRVTADIAILEQNVQE
jgi:hypothetical protein